MPGSVCVSVSAGERKIHFTKDGKETKERKTPEIESMNGTNVATDFRERE